MYLFLLLFLCLSVSHFLCFYFSLFLSLSLSIFLSVSLSLYRADDDIIDLDDSCDDIYDDVDFVNNVDYIVVVFDYYVNYVLDIDVDVINVVYDIDNVVYISEVVYVIHDDFDVINNENYVNDDVDYYVTYYVDVVFYDDLVDLGIVNIFDDRKKKLFVQKVKKT